MSDDVKQVMKVLDEAIRKLADHVGSEVSQVSDRILKPRSFEEVDYLEGAVLNTYAAKCAKYQKEIDAMHEPYGGNPGVDGSYRARLQEVLADYIDSVRDILNYTFRK
jgi:hypothetical protein